MCPTAHRANHSLDTAPWAPHWRVKHQVQEFIPAPKHIHLLFVLGLPGLLGQPHPCSFMLTPTSNPPPVLQPCLLVFTCPLRLTFTELSRPLHQCTQMLHNFLTTPYPLQGKSLTLPPAAKVIIQTYDSVQVTSLLLSSEWLSFPDRKWLSVGMLVICFGKKAIYVLATAYLSRVVFWQSP